MSASDDEKLWNLVLGGIIGASMASPKPEDKQELQEYRNLKQIWTLRQQQIGPLPTYEKLTKYQGLYPVFVEIIRLYNVGFLRAAAIESAAVIEATLRIKFQEG